MGLNVANVACRAHLTSSTSESEWQPKQYVKLYVEGVDAGGLDAVIAILCTSQ